jgi:hypothetical protein
MQFSQHLSIATAVGASVLPSLHCRLGGRSGTRV